MASTDALKVCAPAAGAEASEARSPVSHERERARAGQAGAIHIRDRQWDVRGGVGRVDARRGGRAGCWPRQGRRWCAGAAEGVMEAVGRGARAAGGWHGDRDRPRHLCIRGRQSVLHPRRRDRGRPGAQPGRGRLRGSDDRGRRRLGDARRVPPCRTSGARWSPCAAGPFRPAAISEDAPGVTAAAAEEAAPRRRPAPGEEPRHDQGRAQRAVEPAIVVAPQSLLLELHRAIEADRGLVVGEDLELDLVGVRRAWRPARPPSAPVRRLVRATPAGPTSPARAPRRPRSAASRARRRSPRRLEDE